ncbi:hypothetical protein NIES2100_05910 [Calothrix sp. NIES-2100]|uniref:hypothetical protein n=1 Tax=Calothrix sp. NIES-2100 TaxID=1954172 RepID=UPI000B620C78|nr:hypothetical protein NIES2100_05910 [Calothrix sp. NIES-2100]
MNKQKFSLSLSLVLVLSSSLVVASNRADASPFQSLGNTTDSSGFSGDTFTPGGVGTSAQPNILPGTNVEISPSGKIVVSEAVQNRVNGIASEIKGEARDINDCLAAVASVLFGGGCAPQAKEQVQSTLESYQVRPELAKAFVDSVSGLLANGNVDITQLNIAINNWNNIVKQLNPSDLQKVKDNRDFEQLTRNLKRLRAGLKKLL